MKPHTLRQYFWQFVLVATCTKLSKINFIIKNYAYMF